MQWLVSACNSLFYFPTAEQYVAPEQLPVKVEDVYFKSADGTKLHAWLLHPQGGKSQGVVIHFHGNAQNLSSHIGFSYWLALEGFYVFAFDYRGYGLSEGSPDREGLVEDGMAALAFVKNEPRLQGENIFILGQSLGGAVAIPALAIAKTPGVKAVALDSTFYSYRAMARDRLGSVWLTWPLQWPLSFLVSDEYSAIDYISAIAMPLVFIHGTADPIVPKEMMEPLYDKASEPKELWILESNEHTAALVGDDATYRKKLATFFRQHSKEKKP